MAILDVAESLSSHPPSLAGSMLPPVDTLPANIVSDGESGESGESGEYILWSESMGMRRSRQQPIAGVRSIHRGWLENWTITFMPANVNAWPASRPVRSRRVNDITAGSGCSSMPSLPQSMVKESRAATSLVESFTGVQPVPLPVSMNMKHCCIYLMTSLRRSRPGAV